MLTKESEWFKNKIEHYLSMNDCVLNVGSSTKKFRENIQPHIQKNIFDLLEQKKIKVIHIDMKQDEGVDLVGDVTDNNFIATLRKLHPTAIICSNLLEHLENREHFCNALVNLLSTDGLLFVSCPKDYPYHEDPIDTMFRPTVEELAKEFPRTVLVEGEVLACGTEKEEEKYSRMNNRLRWLFRDMKSIIKLFLPFYKPRNWWKSIKRLFSSENKPISATCVVLRKVLK